MTEVTEVAQFSRALPQFLMTFGNALLNWQF